MLIYNQFMRFQIALRFYSRRLPVFFDSSSAYPGLFSNGFHTFNIKIVSACL